MGKPGRTRLIALALCTTSVLAAGLLLRPDRGLPAIEWRVGPADAAAPASAYQPLAPEAHVTANVVGGEPLHVYVASWSAEDGTIAWFPSGLLRSDLRNPIAAGAHELPGRCDGKRLSFRARPGHGVTIWIAVAAREPLRELDETFARLRQVSNQTFTDGSIVVSNPRQGAPIAGPGSAPPGLLMDAAGLPPDLPPNGPMRAVDGRPGVWVAVWRTVAERDAEGLPLRQQPLEALRPMLLQQQGPQPEGSTPGPMPPAPPAPAPRGR